MQKLIPLAGFVVLGPLAAGQADPLPLFQIRSNVTPAHGAKPAPTPLPVQADVKSAPGPRVLTATADPLTRPQDHSTRLGSSPGKDQAAAQTVAPMTRALTRIYFDEPGDGRIWANAPGYKASFGTEGFTYVPFFGSDAPRNYPVRFAVSEASVDGLPLDAELSSIRRHQDSVDLDRGAFIERYHLGLESIEQTFVIESLADRGALRIVLDLETDLVPARDANGIVLGGPAGDVHFGDVTVVDASGATYETPATVDDGRIVIDVDAAFMNTALLPIVVDPIIRTWSFDSTRNLISPDTAYDTTNEVWGIAVEEVFSQTDSDVLCLQRTRAGDPIQGSGVYTDFTTTSWSGARIANNNIGDQFLSVAQRDDGVTKEIWGRTRDAGSISQGAQFKISDTMSGDKLTPDVGGDPLLFGPTYFCVVWTRRFNANDYDVHYRLVRNDSTLVGSGTQLIDNTTAFDVNPSISNSNGKGPSSGQSWNIVWERHDLVPDNVDVHAAQINWDGAIRTASFPLVVTNARTTVPRASTPLDGTNGFRRWACVWRSSPPPGGYGDLGIIPMLGDIPQMAINLTLREEQVTGSIHGIQDQTDPEIISDGTEYRVVYSESFMASTDYDVFTSTLLHEDDEVVLVTTHVGVANSTTVEEDLHGASEAECGGDPGRTMFMWRDRNLVTGDDIIEGAIAVQSDRWESISEVVCSSFNNSAGSRSHVRVLGSRSIGTNRIRLDVHALPPNVFGFFVTGPQQVSQPLGQGTLCVGQVQRLNEIVQNSGAARSIWRSLNLTNLPAGVQIPVGTQYFQFWHRDVVGGMATSNMSDAVSVQFTN